MTAPSRNSLDVSRIGDRFSDAWSLRAAPEVVRPKGADNPAKQMRLLIESPAGNTRGPVFTESLLRTIHRANPKRLPLSLRIQNTSSGVGLVVDCPDELRALFMQEFQDTYPGTRIRVAPDDEEVPTVRLPLFKRPDVLPIRTYDDFVDETDKRQLADPSSGLLSAIRTGTSGRLQCSINLEFQPATHRRVYAAERISSVLNRSFRFRWLRRTYIRSCGSSLFFRFIGWTLSFLIRKKSEHDRDGSELAVESLFECRLTLTVIAALDAAQFADKKLSEIAGTFGRFNNGECEFFTLRRKTRRGFLMSAKEIATIWHPLTASGDTVSRAVRPTFVEVEPPILLTTKKGKPSSTVLGRTVFRRQRNQFGIMMDDLRRHLMVIGKTGCGKSTFLLSVVRQQIEHGRGTILFDPHGQLADEVLNVVPKHRTNDVVVFDASDNVAPVRFNPMVGPPGTDPTLIADGVLTSFKNVFGFDAGSAPRLLHIFRNCLLTLIGTPHASIGSVQRLLVDPVYRKSCIASVQNIAVREFWLTEFNRWNERDRTQYIASLQNKLGAFTTNERLQLILDGGKKGIVLRELMDESKILICNLSKGTVGHDASTLLGSLLLSSLQIAAMSRANIPEADRRDCVVVIDEFHSYLAEGNTTMADALAESRKYRTSYVLSAQMLEQLDTATLAGVLGNCGSTMCMTVGPRDAETLAELLGAGLTPADLMQIPKYHAYLRMLIEGAAHTFSMTTLAPSKHTPNRADTIRRVSRQRFGS